MNKIVDSAKAREPSDNPTSLFSLAICPARIMVFIGPNGAGKSSVLYYLLSFENPLVASLEITEAEQVKVVNWTQGLVDVSIPHSMRASSTSEQIEWLFRKGGSGACRLVASLLQFARTPRGGRLGIEEPETSLHPITLGKLADLFVKITTEKQQRLIITTHSEYLLFGLLNNVAEGKLASKDLAIYNFSLSGTDPFLERLEVDRMGMVKGGLPGFYDAALETQRRHLDAQNIIGDRGTPDGA